MWLLRCLFAGGIFICTLPAALAAQDKNFSNSFYEKNFADKMSQHSRAKEPVGAPAEAPSEAPAAAPRPGDSKSDPKNASAAARAAIDRALQRSPGAAAAPAEYHGEAAGAPVIAVGAILNSSDEKHLHKQMELLLELLHQRKMNAGMVYVTGPMATFESRQATLLGIYGGMVTQLAGSLPPRYKNVAHSPTWILYSNDFEILLEGVKSPERYITKDRCYTEPAPEAAAAPTKKPEATPVQPALF